MARKQKDTVAAKLRAALKRQGGLRPARTRLKDCTPRVRLINTLVRIASQEGEYDS